MKIAYLCEPQLGGTYTFFKVLRPLLAQHGMDFVCVSEASPEWFSSSRFSKDAGVLCAALNSKDTLADQTRSLISFLHRHSFDAVVTLPACSLVTSNLPRYLPRSIKCFVSVPMMTRGAYVPVRAMQHHLNGILAVSDRIRTDLIKYGIPPELVKTIFHGVSINPSGNWKQCKSSSGPLRLLYAGRLTDLDKGVLLLPDIMHHVRKANGCSHLSVVGAGQDEDRLKAKIEAMGLTEFIFLRGKRPMDEMVQVYRQADVLLLPSRFEGCGFSLLEAMAEGCVPVASDIHGSVRTILDNGKAGKLVPLGNAHAFAKVVLEWERDRETLRTMQEAAYMRVSSEYTLDKMGQAYASVFSEALREPDLRTVPQDVAHYSIPPELSPTWRTHVPIPVKNWVRSWLEKFSISV